MGLISKDKWDLVFDGSNVRYSAGSNVGLTISAIAFWLIAPAVRQILAATLEVSIRAYCRLEKKKIDKEQMTY